MTVILRLYVAGTAPNSIHAIANARIICEALPEHQLEIIDLLDHPRRAKADGIIVTPTLLKLAPAPVRRLIGTLSDAAKVIQILRGT